MPEGDRQAATPSTNRPTRKTAAKNRPYHHGALRGALLDAAEQVLLREGVEGLTLRAVAREAGVATTRNEELGEVLTLAQAAGIASAWSLVEQ